MPSVDRLTPVLHSQVQNVILTQLGKVYPSRNITTWFNWKSLWVACHVYSMIYVCDLYSCNRMNRKHIVCTITFMVFSETCHRFPISRNYSFVIGVLDRIDICTCSLCFYTQPAFAVISWILKFRSLEAGDK